MLVTLNKANKLVKKLNNYLHDNFQTRGSVANIDKSFQIKDTTICDTDKFMTEMREKQKENADKLEQYFNLLEDSKRLKEQLFRENINSGLSEVLYKISIVTSKVSTLEYLLKNIKSNYNSFDLNNELVEKINAGGLTSEYSRSISINVFDENEIEKRLGEARIELNLLEDKKDSFNSNKKITIELHDYTKSVLGLE